MFSSSRRLKKTAKLVLYDEEHFQGTWQRDNLEDYYRHVLNWFEKYV